MKMMFDIIYQLILKSIFLFKNILKNKKKKKLLIDYILTTKMTVFDFKEFYLIRKVLCKCFCHDLAIKSRSALNFF